MGFNVVIIALFLFSVKNQEITENVFTEYVFCDTVISGRIDGKHPAVEPGRSGVWGNPFARGSAAISRSI